MQFRYLALIALWTLISGPLIGVPTSSPAPSPKSAPAGAQISQPKKAPTATKAVRVRWGW